MRIEKNQLHLASLLTQHVLKELVPSAYLKEAFVDAFSFNLLLEIPVDMQPEMKDFIERRIAEVQEQIDVKEMLESNARDYLHSHGEKKLAKQLGQSGRRLVSVVQCHNTVFLSFDECAKELGTVSILEFAPWDDNLWLLRGSTSFSKQELQKRKKLYNQNALREYKRRAQAEGYFDFSSKGTTWHQDGIICKETIQHEIRKVYNSLGIRQMEGKRALDQYSLVSCEDTLFPGSQCLGDMAETERVMVQDEALDLTYDALVRLGIPEARIEKQVESLRVRDTMGIWRETTRIARKKGQEVPFLRLQVFRSIERVVALLLELAKV